MSEDKIMDLIKGKLLMIEKMLKQDDEEGHTSAYEMQFEDFEAIQGLLDLYQKEKETSHFLQSELDQANAKIIEEKEKNRWKPISEYNRKKYDWVLVKYFDGDYECVPEVAEQRIDGKWYTTEREIPFEVKYFFDMQELLEERN